MHVVDQKEVSLTKSPAKLVCLSRLDGEYELIGELLGAEKEYPRLGCAVEYVMRHGLHEVCFAKPGITVDEERVVNAPRGCCYGLCSSCCKLVRLSDDEILECIPGAKLLDATMLRIRGSGAFLRRWCYEQVHLRTSLL